MLLEEVSKVYQLGQVEVPALRAVSLSVCHGEMVAITGASDSGKSTALNLIIEPWAMAAGVLAGVLTAVVFGLYPAIRAARVDVIEALRSE